MQGGNEGDGEEAKVQRKACGGAFEGYRSAYVKRFYEAFDRMRQGFSVMISKMLIICEKSLQTIAFSKFLCTIIEVLALARCEC